MFRSFNQLLSLWDRWEKDEPLGTGYAPFKHLFAQLHTLRPWGPQDRIPDETILFWQEEIERHPDRAVRTEVELWFHNSDSRRRQASQTLESIVSEADGRLVHEAVIREIVYHGALIDIPASEIPGLIERRAVRLALADGVFFYRPQSMLLGPVEVEPVEDASVSARAGSPPQNQPIAALLDGVPVQAHALLTNRLILDDPDELQNRAIVSRRIHGTTMASLKPTWRPERE